MKKRRNAGGLSSIFRQKLAQNAAESDRASIQGQALSDFDFELPEALIAQAPLADRTAAKLLVIGASLQDKHIRDLPELLAPGDLLVFNDTRVIPARLFASKATGGRVEVLLTKALGVTRYQAMLRNAQKQKPGDELRIADGFSVRINRVDGGGFYEVELLTDDVMRALDEHGHIPLPPYIRRADTASDRETYQTMFAAHAGSAAAPTAGLHFTPALLEQLHARGVQHTTVTLHVGPGTFLPVREEAEDDITKHKMHSERYAVPEAALRAIDGAKRVIAVGTTSVRTLESYAATGAVAGDTELFITPGYDFKVIDGMLTNFHLPRSTLLILVSALAGLDRVKAAYAHAVANNYRFFSYGDACLFL